MKNPLLFVKRHPLVDSYHTEECDGQTQHWISVKDGYIFAETETQTINGFDLSEMMYLFDSLMTTKEFYGD
jgi:hypothetical protein